jgi:phosphate ABC transporter phosphate-binding protein
MSRWTFTREQRMSNVSIKMVSILVLVGAALCVLVYYSPAFLIPDKPAPPQVTRLQTGGTSVVAFLLENRWGGLYRDQKGVQVGYDSTGSSHGIERMIDGEYAIGFTHAALTDAQMKAAEAKGGAVLHIPVVICAVVPIYNVKELRDKPPLNFTGEVLADIFRGTITKWNDPALAKLNDDTPLPDEPIQVVHREDSSGTTFIFTDYLHGASAAWRKDVGPPANTITWPAGEGKNRNHGVADHVYRTPGAIGYIDRLFVGYGDLKHGAVQNRDGTAFIHAAADNMTAALHGQLASLPDDLTFRLTNQAGKNAYPICGCVWAVCYKTQPAARHKLVTDFLQWITHDGQQYATDVAYAPLPDEVIARIDEKLKLITAGP